MFMRNLVLVIVCDDCLVRRSICSCIPDSRPHRITSMKCGEEFFGGKKLVFF